jgi:SAM-dependent methyltransferase
MKPLRSEAKRIGQGLQRRWRMARHRGDAVECPLCGCTFDEFAPDHNRGFAKCWRCGSHERHRGLWAYLEARPELLDGSPKLLHFAPEWSLERYLRPRAEYVSADIEPGRADRRLDLMALDLPDDAFDSILCSHVLEHIADDRVGMRELARVLRPGGWLIVMLPVDFERAETYEDATIVDPADRARAFWQDDHLRLYGRDAAERLATATGLEVTVERPADIVGPERARRWGLLESDEVFLCRPVGGR